MVGKRVSRSRFHALPIVLALGGILALGALPRMAAAQTPPASAGNGELVVTVLGAGTPELLPRRFGNSTLVQAGGLNLVFDAGRGAAIRLEQMGVSLGKIDGLFITHYHSDHVNGLADIWMSGYLPPLGGRKTPLQLYGPTGIKHLAEGLRNTFSKDISIREADEHVPPAGTEIDAHEFDHDGVVFQKNGVTVTAFQVNHGPLIKPSYGYRVDYNGHSVTMSSDTKYNDNVIKYGKGADLLLHEVAIAPESIENVPMIQRVMAHHSSPEDAGRVFAQARPKLAAFYHIVRLRGPNAPRASLEEIATRTRKTYDGPLVLTEDLTQFVIGKGVTVIPLFTSK
jgi:ribonuclease Z